MKTPWNQRPSSQSILAEVDSLSHGLRRKRMVELGRQSITEPHLAEALKTLARSEVHYERLLALMSVDGSGDTKLAAAMLTDPSQMLAVCAVKIAARLVPDDVLIALMPNLTPACRKHLAQRLWRAGRAAINDAVYPLVPDAARHILPWTTEAFIRRHLDTELATMLDAPQWAILARRAPGLVRDTLLRELERSHQPSHTLQTAVRAALNSMLRCAPSIGLSLLAKAKQMSFGGSLVERYASLFPGEVADIIRSSGNRSLSFSRHALKRLDAEVVCSLIATGALCDIGWDFPHLLSATRDAIYRRVGESWRDRNGAMPPNIVRALSGPARHAEARHAFALPLLQTYPDARLFYLSCLPVEEALRLARPFLSQPEGELRAQAVAAVVRAGRYEASSLSTILKFCRERDNEQDPVRLAMFTALAELPPSRWQADHLPDFTALIDAALRARDCSHQTMTAATRWLMGIIVTHTGFVADTLPRLVERMGSMAYHVWRHWESRMNDRQMIRIAPRLMGLLKTWIKRDRSQFAVYLIFGFGVRAKAVDQFADILTALTEDKRSATARSGLDALVRIGFTRRVTELIPRLIENDPSWIQVNTVSQHLHLRRQDLLTPFLTARVYKGRFASGKAAFLPTFERGFARWTATQQRIYADSLRGILTSPKRNAWELYQTVGAYAAMPSVDLAPVVDLARQDAADAALRDKALEALGRADAGRGVAALIPALDDSRARVAIYALRRSLLNMPVSQALELAGRMPRAKITVAKEIIRLAGELKSDAAYAFLAQFEADKHLHQDVRIALLRAYWNHLERPEVWQVLHDAATSDLPSVARATIRIPQAGLSRTAQRALTEHLALLLGHSDAQIRKETLERLIAMPPGHGGSSLFAALTAQLDGIDPALVQLAARALLTSYAKDSPQQLADSFASVQQAQSLAAIVSAYQSCQQWSWMGLDASASQLVHALMVRRWHPGQALRLAFLILKPPACLAAAQQFDEAGLLHPGAAHDAIAGVTDMTVRTSPQELASLEASLGIERSVAMRRIGLGLLCEQAAKGGWTDLARQRLAAYRGDSDGWISDAADLVRCPEKLVIHLPPAD